jgi:hypothetical protein
MTRIKSILTATPAELPLLDKQYKYNYDATKDAQVLKYGNQQSPLAFKKMRSGLTPYTGAWNKSIALHLLKRTTMGPRQQDIASLLALTPGAAVDALLNNTYNSLPVPVNYYEATYADPNNVPLGSTWINAPYGDGTVDYYRAMGLNADWLRTIINQNVSIIEQMTLLVYNLVPIQRSAVSAKQLYYYLQLVRQYALGNYKAFIKAITKDSGMLVYLNGFLNNKYSPDENYGRELQELFTVGKDGGQQFTEDDVQTSAKVLTGWRVDFTDYTMFYDDTLHDTNAKTFSAFYNNTTINGVSGPTGGDAELDALLTMIFSGQSGVETAKHIVRRIYSHFIYYNIDASVEANIITPLAQTFINSNWELKPVLAQLLKSDHFFETLQQGCMIKTPLQLVAGLSH